MPVLLNSQNSNFEKEFKKLLLAKREDSVEVDVSVREIIGGVIELGDQALIEYTKKFDRVSLTTDTLRFTQSELKEQAAQVSGKDRSALELAVTRIKSYHEKQLPDDTFWTDESGVELGWRCPTKGPALNNQMAAYDTVSLQITYKNRPKPGGKQNY